MNRKQANKYIHIHFLAVAWLVSRTAWQVTLGLRIRTRTDSQLQLQLSQQLEKVAGQLKVNIGHHCYRCLDSTSHMKCTEQLKHTVNETPATMPRPQLQLSELKIYIYIYVCIYSSQDTAMCIYMYIHIHI